MNIQNFDEMLTNWIYNFIEIWLSSEALAIFSVLVSGALNMVAHEVGCSITVTHANAAVKLENWLGLAGEVWVLVLLSGYRSHVLIAGLLSSSPT